LTGEKVEHSHSSWKGRGQTGCHYLVPVLNSHHLEDSHESMGKVIKGLSVWFMKAIGLGQFVIVEVHS